MLEMAASPLIGTAGQHHPGITFWAVLLGPAVLEKEAAVVTYCTRIEKGGKGCRRLSS